MPHLFDLWGESHENVKWQQTLINIYAKFVKFKNMDPEIQMKDDGLHITNILHMFIYATFVWPPRWKSWKRKMTAYPIFYIHAKYYSVSNDGSGYTDEKS